MKVIVINLARFSIIAECAFKLKVHSIHSTYLLEFSEHYINKY